MFESTGKRPPPGAGDAETPAPQAPRREGLGRLDLQDDALVARILACTARTRELVEEGDRAGSELTRLQGVLESSRQSVEPVLQGAETAITLLQGRIAELEAQAEGALQRLAAAREEGLARAREALAAQTAAQVEAHAALQRLQAVRNETLPLVLHCVDAARSAVALVSATGEAAAQAAAAAATALEERARTSQAGLAAARAAAEAATADAVRRSAELREAIGAGLRGLQEDLETARLDHRRRFDRLVGEVRATSEDWSAVHERFAVGLAAEIAALSQQLDVVLEGMRAMPRPPRRLADEDLFATTRKVRETFDPLSHVEKVWKQAKAMGLA